MSQIVNMIGLGYIGLPTAAVMADSGLNVIGVDINQSACNIINSGKIHIIEPGLEDVVKRVVGEGSLIAQTSPSEADIYVIAVPTPFKDNYVPDLSYVKSACLAIAPHLKMGSLVILESTSPVGTTDKMRAWFSDVRQDLAFASEEDSSPADVFLAYCPERVLPGKVLEELVSNDRAIGGVSKFCSEKAKAFYEHFVDGECVITNARTAEMAKLTENSFRDVNIAFANELSIVCDKLNIDVWELISLSNRHPRVDILQPGCGVGGHCIAVDPWFIVDSAPGQAKLIRQAREINDGKPEWVADKIQSSIFKTLQSEPSKNLNAVRVACFGLAFKPNIDDLRESPAVEVVKHLCLKFPSQIIEVCEPHMHGELPKALQKFTNLKIVNLSEAVTADVKSILVAHDIFKAEVGLSDPSVVNVAWDPRRL
jgi:UDP-N-acetyl-D-mannosaminuronic acid dehydrogenase